MNLKVKSNTRSLFLVNNRILFLYTRKLKKPNVGSFERRLIAWTDVISDVEIKLAGNGGENLAGKGCEDANGKVGKVKDMRQKGHDWSTCYESS